MIKSNPSTWVKTLHDVEVYKNSFITSIKNYETKEVITWEISNRRNDIKEICNFYKNYKNFMISFNGRHYDNIIIKAVLKYQHLDKDKLLLKLKEISDNVITGNYDHKDKDYNKFTWWIDIDFMCYWSKGLRITKQISLKSLAIQIGWDEIEELPYHPNTILEDNQIDRLIRYNVRNDLGILDRLVEVFEGKSDIPLGNLGTIQLRANATKDYGIDMWSYDAPKIAATVLSLDYCNKTETDFRCFKDQRFDKDRFQFKDLFENINFEFTTEIFKNIYNKWMNSYDTFSETFVAHTKDKLNGIKISVGVGGLHSIQEDQIFEENENSIIYDTDIASMYPELILNLHCFRFKEIEEKYQWFKDYRITQTKPNLKKYKGTPEEQYWKDQDSFSKVILNGISGYIDMSKSPLYYNIGAMRMRVYGQLVLCYLTERLLEENIQVIMLNTDGVSMIVPKEKIKLVETIIKSVGDKYNFTFEDNFYKTMIFKNVNNYIAVDTKGNIKKKGLFVTKPELGNSVNELVVPKALEAYFIKGIDYVDFIKNHKNISDFLISQKVNKKYKVFWYRKDENNLPEKIECQRLNRYYASSKNGYLKKKYGKTESHLLKDSGVTIYNKLIPDHFPSDINYRYYINKTSKIIKELEKNKKQLELF